MTRFFTTSHSRTTSIEMPVLNEFRSLSYDETRKQIWQEFMVSYRTATHGRDDIRILLAIQRAADLTCNSDAYVSKVLVEMGLRAPRMAFPGDFLDYIDNVLIAADIHPSATNKAFQDLYAHWVMIGENIFSRSGELSGSEFYEGQGHEPVERF